MKELFDIIWNFLNQPIIILDFKFVPAYFILFSLGVSFFRLILDFYWRRDTDE